MLGHDYTVFLGMRGGKGVATSCGVLLVLAPRSTLATLAVFAVIVRATRMVSAGSLAGALALPLFLWLLGEREAPALCLSLLLAALVWLKHIPNIRRMLAGTESTISFGRRRDGERDGAPRDDRAPLTARGVARPPSAAPAHLEMVVVKITAPCLSMNSNSRFLPLEPQIGEALGLVREEELPRLRRDRGDTGRVFEPAPLMAK